MARISSFREPGERYPVLRLVATLSHGFGVLMLVVSGLLIAVGIGAVAVAQVRPINGLLVGWVALLWALGFLAGGLQTLAFGSFCRLAIHVEENTRATAQALDRLRSAAEAKPEVDARSIFLS